jgi:hypothetical protein
MITPIGALLLPICLWFWRRPSALLLLVMIYSAFSAAALVVVGGFGIAPSLLPTVLFIGIFLINTFNGIYYPAKRLVLGLLCPFILVVCGALASSIIMPRLFEGDVLVWPQKAVAYSTRSTLAPNSGNITQDLYLLADALLTVSGSIYLSRSSSLLTHLLDVYLLSGLLVICISLWQFCSTILHFPYPADFFLSNPGWAQLSDQTMGWLTRLNGPFSEPAALSAYMSAITATSGWIILNGGRRLLLFLSFWGGLATTLLTTASTGYVTLIALSVLVLFYAIFASKPIFRRQMLLGLSIMVPLAGVIVGGALAFAPNVVQEAELVVNATLNKTESDSYQARSAADRDSIQEMQDTYGLGVGWGSNRSSSLLPGLCAAIGIWGVVGLIWFGISININAHRAIRRSHDPALHYVIHGSAASLLSTLISALISGPTISSPDFYLILAMLVGATARANDEAWRLPNKSLHFKLFL